MALLEVRDLSVTYSPRDAAAVRAVEGVSLTIDDGEFVGLLGESGCGKSTLGSAVLRLLEKPAAVTGGSVVFDGVDITAAGEDEIRPLRWAKISTVFQSSMNSLNPVITVEAQFADTFAAHPGCLPPDVDARQRAVDLLEMVELDAGVLRRYPHELSGGMKQRVALALALALSPRFVLLDEPTTGLDVVVQRAILDRLRALQSEFGFAVLFISHDLGTVMEMADRVMVMYAGEIVEDQPAEAMMSRQLHPYTQGLLGSYADPRDAELGVDYVPGRPPNLADPPAGCRFASRCQVAVDDCSTVHPELLPATSGAARCLLVERAGGTPVDAELSGRFVAARPATLDEKPVLAVRDVAKHYRVRRRGGHTVKQAVEGVSFELRPGRVTALVGQSGSGKTTLARLITGIEQPTAGTVSFTPSDGSALDVGRLRGRRLRAYHRHAQLVFQDPFGALNPTRTLAYALTRPLRNHLGLSPGAARQRAGELLETVGLSPAAQYLDKLPHQLSGGQRQRVVVARALAPEPTLLVADEPISMLDVSIRAEIIQLLDGLVRDLGIAMLYITHDLLSARLLADEVLVLKEGRVVEEGPTLQVIRHAEHAYTKLLLDSIPNPRTGSTRRNSRAGGTAGLPAAPVIRG
ncbi:ABC transporter ATP-binding protein [Streptomyces luteolus]|uniref:ABC transporter ATP-binding protein n=1 Tax=Streptomyces luteolus TaxID=3043615 RepID=A0ABT6SSZ1_9ACTN|nr:ABC transporter ATP-binding protein [Streptomyces sp. B-S-A12]MDI3418723.1 ABC transporter ATP-binding protein [Streptomyces sp. B-S-A12]